MLRVHHLQVLDISEGEARNPLLCFAEHRCGKIYPDDTILGGVTGERDARADTNFENPATDLLRCGDRRPPPAIEHSTKDQIVDRSPARIRLLYGDPVKFCRQFLFNCFRHQTTLPLSCLKIVIKSLPGPRYSKVKKLLRFDGDLPRDGSSCDLAETRCGIP